MKKILVPTDFSKEALNALKIAYSIAKNIEAEIDLLHVEEPIFEGGFSATGEPQTSGDDNLFMVKLLEKVKGYMHKLSTKPEFSDVKINRKVEFGNIHETIEGYIKENQPDLAVMGSRGLSETDKFLIGSNTDKMVKLAKCPVLVVNKEHKDVGFDNIVFATNGEEDITIAITKLKEIQKKFNSKIHLVRVVTIADFATNQEVFHDLELLVKNYGLENYSLNIYNDAGIEEGIINFANSIEADMVSMVTHHRSYIGYLLNGSVSRNVLTYTNKPFLALNLT